MRGEGVERPPENPKNLKIPKFFKVSTPWLLYIAEHQKTRKNLKYGRVISAAENFWSL